MPVVNAVAGQDLGILFRWVVMQSNPGKIQQINQAQLTL
jgi:hypothetical protein